MGLRWKAVGELGWTPSLPFGSYGNRTVLADPTVHDQDIRVGGTNLLRHSSRGGDFFGPGPSGRSNHRSPDRLRLGRENDLCGSGTRSRTVYTPFGPAGKTMPAKDTSEAVHSRVVLDQYSGQALQVNNFLTDSMGYRVIRFNRSIHTGDVLGTPTHPHLGFQPAAGRDGRYRSGYLVAKAGGVTFLPTADPASPGILPEELPSELHR